MKTVYTDKAPAAIGPYSQAMVSGGFVFTSGQIPVDPQSGEIVGADVTAQALSMRLSCGGRAASCSRIAANVS